MGRTVPTLIGALAPIGGRAFGLALACAGALLLLVDGEALLADDEAPFAVDQMRPAANEALRPAEQDAALQATSRAASLAAACSGCHRAGQKSLVNLDSLSADTLTTKFKAYKADANGTTVMHRLARGYSEADIQAVVAYLKAGKER